MSQLWVKKNKPDNWDYSEGLATIGTLSGRALDEGGLTYAEYLNLLKNHINPSYYTIGSNYSTLMKGGSNILLLLSSYHDIGQAANELGKSLKKVKKIKY